MRVTTYPGGIVLLELQITLYHFRPEWPVVHQIQVCDYAGGDEVRIRRVVFELSSLGSGR